MTLDAAAARELHALADPMRWEILTLLAARPSGVTELSRALPITRQGTAKHLGLLREAGMVAVDDEHRAAIYQVRPGAVARLAQRLTAAAAAWDTQLGLLKAAAERPLDAAASASSEGVEPGPAPVGDRAPVRDGAPAFDGARGPDAASP